MDDAAKLIDRAVGLREAALTPAQRARKAVVEARNKGISEGVRPPKSGVFGRPAKD